MNPVWVATWPANWPVRLLSLTHLRKQTFIRIRPNIATGIKADYTYIPCRVCICIMPTVTVTESRFGSGSSHTPLGTTSGVLLTYQHHVALSGTATTAHSPQSALDLDSVWVLGLGFAFGLTLGSAPSPSLAHSHVAFLRLLLYFCCCCCCCFL